VNFGVERLLTAIESRDLRRVADALTPDVTWQNVPHAPAVGRDAVVALLAGIVSWSDAVRWDVVSTATDGELTWCERVDRFVIAGDEHAVRCNGVFRVDPASGCVAEVRDYVDLGEWRARIARVMTAMSTRPAREVVARHLAAVERRDPVAMSADYALDAVLERAGERYEGYAAIARYFDTVPDRLGAHELHLDHVADTDVRWTIPGVASGRDEYEVRAGRITRQTVTLASTDF
jgi:limonene-1,2-epoxide hydrolase